MDSIHSKILLTVLMAVRNASPFIKEAVDSIVNQSYSNFIFLIIDNNSSDGTYEYLSSLNDPRIILMKYNRIGIVEALNFGLSQINTKYTAIMDADDISDPNRLEKQIDFLENNTDVGLLGTSVKYFTRAKGRRWKLVFPQNHNEIVSELLSGNYVLTHPTVMLRTDLLKKIGGYRTNSYPVPDLDMFLRLSRITKLSNLPNVFCSYRIHSQSYTVVNLEQIVVKQKEILSRFKGRNLKPTFASYYANKFRFYSLYFYRKGLHEFLEGGKLLWLFFLFISAILNPVKIPSHLAKKMMK